MKLKTIPELNFGFSDAVNYRMKEYKELFNHIFVRTEELDALCKTNIIFLLGEKGTGKTAYALYLSNNMYANNSSALNYLRETEYQKFVALKQEKHLALSDYSDIWKVSLYLLMAQRIANIEKKKISLAAYTKFRDLKRAIDEYYAYAFAPEIVTAMNFIEQSKIAAELIAKYCKVGASKMEGTSFNESHFQTNLLYIQRSFEEALRSLKLDNNHLLFIDGIDVRPPSIPLDIYLDCIKGLANAVWSMNTDFFASIKDSKGRMRVILLIRPDIFNALALQNQNNKVRDNSVLLDWRSTYPQYRKSKIFSVADRLLKIQQTESLADGVAWDYYFPYRTVDTKGAYKREHDSFIKFLRFSLYRPRDIITMLGFLQENFILQGRSEEEVFKEDDFDNTEFVTKYSNYLLGEIKDHFRFYYTNTDYELFLNFFQFLNGRLKFSYEEYKKAFNNMIEYLNRNSIQKPIFFKSTDSFLQFLYEMNVIFYIEDTEDEPFIRYCFRERTLSDLSPKVKTEQRYEIHYGLAKALNLGKSYKRHI